MKIRTSALVLGLAIALGSVLAQAAEEAQVFDIPAQPLATALRKFAEQTELQLVFETDLATEKTSSEVKGRLSDREALERLLSGSGLRFEFLDDRTVAVSMVDKKKESNSSTRNNEVPGIKLPQVADTQSIGSKALQSRDKADLPNSSSPTEADGITTMPEILVQGRRSLNTDIRRTEDDVQPYVVLTRADIETSGASTIEDFLRTKLPMNASSGTNLQMSPNLGGTSQVNLRGLGTNQTLILVDGRRLSSINGTALGFGPIQSDINGIPLSSIERIEILPTTASGIYGGGATGGVVNIVLRRDYSGFEVSSSYDITSRGDAPSRRVDASSGLSFGGTSLTASASFRSAEDLRVQERDFFEEGRKQIFTRNPTFFIGPFTQPLGSGANITSLDGSELILKDGTSIGAAYTNIPTGISPSSRVTAALANAGTYDFGISDSAQIFGGGRRSLQGGYRSYSVNGTLRQSIGSDVTFFTEASYNRNIGRSVLSNLYPSSYIVSGSASANPFAQDVAILVPVSAADGTVESESISGRYAAGIIAKITRSWSLSADYTRSYSGLSFTQPPYGFNGGEYAPISNGDIDLLGDSQDLNRALSPFIQGTYVNSPQRSNLDLFATRVSGEVASLPGGPATLTFQAEHRREEFKESRQTLFGFPDAIFPARSQSVSSAFVEAQLPIFGPRNRRPALEELEFQIALRHDRYRVKSAPITPGSGLLPTFNEGYFNSTDPTVGFKYSPIGSVTIRSSYGTGFLPPTVSQLVPSIDNFFGIPLGLLGLTDPKRGNELLGPGDTLSGGNAALQPEQSETFSAGLIFSPEFAKGLRVSLDYTNLKKTDNISTVPGGFQGVINNEDNLPGRITRAASEPGDPYAVGPITIIDATLLNIARAKLEAYDLSASYEFDILSDSKFGLQFIGTYQPHYITQLSVDSPPQENAGYTGRFTASTPTKWRTNGSIFLRSDQWSVQWNAYYYSSYLVDESYATAILGDPFYQVPAQLYNDLYVSFRPTLPGNSGKVLEIVFLARNILDKKPPFDPGNNIYYYSTIGDPRRASYAISIKMAF